VGYDSWEVSISLPAEQGTKVLEGVRASVEATPVFPSSNTIGGKVASDTQWRAAAALLASLVFIVAYIWIRFQRVMFGLAAVVALVHDVLVTLGAIALTYYLAPFLGVLLIDEFKIGLPVLAAFLTIIGYSLNDTIVVFDRIREVRGKAPNLTAAMINKSLNQTLSRTLLTSFTTLIVVVILYAFGGQAIRVFAFSLVVGVIVGTYSSIFVASPVLLWIAQSSEGKKS
jgi:SecD/SecF fusion protein